MQIAGIRVWNRIEINRKSEHQTRAMRLHYTQRYGTRRPIVSHMHTRPLHNYVTFVEREAVGGRCKVMRQQHRIQLRKPEAGMIGGSRGRGRQREAAREAVCRQRLQRSESERYVTRIVSDLHSESALISLRGSPVERRERMPERERA